MWKKSKGVIDHIRSPKLLVCAANRRWLAISQLTRDLRATHLQLAGQMRLLREIQGWGDRGSTGFHFHPPGGYHHYCEAVSKWSVCARGRYWPVAFIDGMLLHLHGQSPVNRPLFSGFVGNVRRCGQVSLGLYRDRSSKSIHICLDFL